MSHICSVECYVSRWIKSFPSPSCACASSVGRQTEDGRKMSKKENSRRCRRDFWPSLTSTAAALSWLAVEYAAALVNAHKPRFLSSIYNWTNLNWIFSDIFGLHWLIMNPPLYMEQFWSRMYLCSTRNKAICAPPETRQVLGWMGWISQYLSWMDFPIHFWILVEIHSCWQAREDSVKINPSLPMTREWFMKWKLYKVVFQFIDDIFLVTNDKYKMYNFDTADERLAHACYQNVFHRCLCCSRKS